MRVIERLELFRARNSVASGPEGPRYVAAENIHRPLPSHLRRHRNWVASKQTELAAKATITAIALGVRHAPSFDPQQVQMPIFYAHAPQGLSAPKSIIVRALMRQHVAHAFVMYAELAGALILLCHGQPRQALRMVLSEDDQTNAHKAMILDLFVGPPLYAGAVACKFGVVMVKRAMVA